MVPNISTQIFYSFFYYFLIFFLNYYFILKQNKSMLQLDLSEPVAVNAYVLQDLLKYATFLCCSIWKIKQ